MQWLKQSTSITIRIGPFVDDTDGKTAETGLTISQADIRLSKNGGDFAQSNDATGATHDENGWYYLTLDATDTGTLGRLDVAISESGALPVWREYMVVPAVTYDSLVSGSDYLTVDAVQVEGGDATDAITAAATASLNSYDPPTNAEMLAAHSTTDGLITTVDTVVDSILADTGTDGVVLADNAITAAKVATDAIDADALAADAGTEIADAILKRDWTSVTGEAARSVLNALRFLRNKWSISGSTLTVTKEDDSTSAWTSALTSDSGADPVTASDPT